MQLINLISFPKENKIAPMYLDPQGKQHEPSAPSAYQAAGVQVCILWFGQQELRQAGFPVKGQK